MRSPTEISMSIARGFGCSEIRCASATSSSVVSPIAESTATTRPPSSFAETIRRISDGESVTSLFAEQNNNF